MTGDAADEERYPGVAVMAATEEATPATHGQTPAHPRRLVALGRSRALSRTGRGPERAPSLARGTRQGVQVPTTAGSESTRSIGDSAGFFVPAAGAWLVTIHVDGIGSTPAGSELTVPSANPSESIAVVATSSVVHR